MTMNAQWGSLEQRSSLPRLAHERPTSTEGGGTHHAKVTWFSERVLKVFWKRQQQSFIVQIRDESEGQ